MDINVVMNEVVLAFVQYLTNILMPLMAAVLGVGIVLRVLVYWSIKREEWFAREFEKRVDRYLSGDLNLPYESFYVLVKKLLERTYYELFELRALVKRRKPDEVMVLADRVFLIKPGTAWTVKDVLKRIRFLRRDGEEPRLLEISKATFQNNPCFTRVLGILPGGPTNDILNILPGMFIIGGILGTFLGIMQALPMIQDLDLSNIEASQKKIGEFLLKVSFSMGTSIVGIIFSVIMKFLNTLWSPQKVFVGVVDRFNNSLHALWHRARTNDLPEDLEGFDEHRDPVEALAEESLNQEYERYNRKGPKGKERRRESEAKSRQAS